MTDVQHVVAHRRRERGDARATPSDLARSRRREPREHAQQRRLASAVAAADDQRGAGRDAKRKSGEQAGRATMPGEVECFEHRSWAFAGWPVVPRALAAPAYKHRRRTGGSAAIRYARLVIPARAYERHHVRRVAPRSLAAVSPALAAGKDLGHADEEPHQPARP